MLLSGALREPIKGWLRGDRAGHTVDFTLQLPMPRGGETITLTMEPLAARARRPEGQIPVAGGATRLV